MGVEQDLGEIQECAETFREKSKRALTHGGNEQDRVRGNVPAQGLRATFTNHRASGGLESLHTVWARWLNGTWISGGQAQGFSLPLS